MTDLLENHKNITNLFYKNYNDPYDTEKIYIHAYIIIHTHTQFVTKIWFLHALSKFILFGVIY